MFRATFLLILTFCAPLQAVTPTTTVLASGANPAKYGQPLALTATVSATMATGKVTFYDGVTILGIGTLSAGQAHLTTSLIASGARSLRAYYGGDSNYAASSSATVAQTVNTVAGGAFSAPIAITSGYTGELSGFATADFNGDGKPDVAGIVQGTLGILLGNGDGTFQPQSSISLTCEPTGMVAADLNGDGKADLVLACGGQLAVLLGNGDGTFQTPAYISLAANVSTLAVADFNGDGKADLAVSSSYPTYGVTVLLGNGDGTFGSQFPNALPNEGVQIITGDFNGDGKPDLALDTGSGITVLLGNGDGSMQAAATYSISNVSSIAAGDLNLDGKLDLIAASSPSSGVGDIVVLLGTGIGTFQSAVYYGSVYQPAQIQIADFNGDGKPDLALSDSSGPAYMLGDGTGAFLSSVRIEVNSALGSNGSLAIADFNGDGRPDLLLAYPAVQVLLGATPASSSITLSAPGTSTLGQSVQLSATVTPATIAGRVTFLDAGSIVGDGAISGGIATLSTGSLGAGRHALMAEFPGNAQFKPAYSAQTSLTVNSVAAASVSLSQVSTGSFAATSASIGDFNGDGKPDLALFSGSAITVLLNNGNGTFHQSFTYAYVAYLNGPTMVADVNNDGKLDILVGGYEFLGNGDGTFSAPVPSSISNYYYYSVTTPADFNLDGNADFVNGSALAIGYAEPLAVYDGNGTGTFYPSYAGSPAFAWVVGDFNGDGIPDLGAIYGGAINILFGYGNGTFRAPVTTPLSGSLANASNYVAGDFNNDGKTDLAVAVAQGVYYGTADGGANVAILLGNGDGTFIVPLSLFPTVGNPTYMAALDFNGDGKLDVAVASNQSVAATYGTVVSVLPGNGDGTLGNRIDFAAPSVNMLAPTDFNGDGKTDLLLGTYQVPGSQLYGINLLLGGSAAYTMNPAGATVAASGGSGSIAVTGPAATPWTALSSDPWLTLSGGSGNGNGSILYSAAANSTGQTRRGTISIGAVAFTVTQPATPNFTTTGYSQTIPASGGTYSVGGATTAINIGTVAWPGAVSNQSWLTISSNADLGNGDGYFTFTAAANTSTQMRCATISMGITMTVCQQGQGATYAIAGGTVSAPASGGSYTESVTVSPASAGWTAYSLNNWVTVTSGSGVGSGAISFTVAPNSSSQSRSTSIALGSGVLYVQQAGQVPTYTFNPATAVAPAEGGDFCIGLTLNPSDATWYALSNQTWATGEFSCGSNYIYGYGVISANTTAAARTATLTILITGVTPSPSYSISQLPQGTVSSYTAAPATASIGASGGQGTIGVSTSQANLLWKATSSQTWLTVTGGGLGAGAGTVTYTAQSNFSPLPRSATITVGDGLTLNSNVTITQAAGPGCGYVLGQVITAASGAASNYSVSVTAAAGCAWNAASNSSWLTVTGGASGSGNGTVTYAVAANATGSLRSGTLTIAGQTFTFAQAANAANQVPALVSLYPFQGQGQSANLSLTYSDPNGWAAIQSAQFIMNPNWEPGSRNGGCYVQYAPGTQLWTLIADDGVSAAGTAALGSSTNLSNSQCTLNIGSSTAYGNGAQLSLNVYLTFTPNFTGQRHIWMEASDYNNVSTNWLVYGVWFPNTTTVSATPWYQIYDPFAGNYLYSSDPNEYATLGTEGFTLQGPLGLVMNTPTYVDGVSNLAWYRVYVNSTSSHFWTSDRNEFLTIINEQQAYVGEGVAAFVMPYIDAFGNVSPQVTNSIPFWRGVYTGANLHYWTVQTTAFNATTGYGEWPPGYVGEGIACYIFPTTGAQFSGATTAPATDDFVGRDDGSPAVVSVSNGASYARSGVIVPGQALNIHGRHLGGRVLLNGVAAEVISSKEGEIRIAAPKDFAGAAEVKLEVESKGRKTKPVTLGVVKADPAIFASNVFGRGNAQAANEDGTANGTEHAAARESLVTLYTTGYSAGGKSDLPLEVHIGGQPAEVVSAQPSASRAGTVEVRVRVPENVPPGPFQPVVLHVGNLFSQPGVGLAIR